MWLIRSGGLEGSGGRTPDKRVLPPGGVERIKAGGRDEAFISQAASYLSVRGGGLQGRVELAEA